MPPTTQLEPLSQGKRRIFFLTLVIIFCLAVPLMVFYAIGYRFDFNEIRNIKAVGGMYISSGVSEGTIYVDEKLVEDMRIFRSAAYIQNLEEGVHQVNVQQTGLQTWAKELPVFAHLVTEAESFNMPEVPQIRIVTNWIDADGAGVLFEAATSTRFGFASNTTPVILATSTSATTTLTENTEFSYVASLFASSTAERNLRQQLLLQNQQRFSFATATRLTATTTATTTKLFQDTILYTKDDEVFVSWRGNFRDIPYYYCVTYVGPRETARLYGQHVYDLIELQLGDTIGLRDSATVGQRLCREEIRIDRISQDIKWFDFMPNTQHIVLMHLDDGLYAVEVDDRSWQNTQLLYPGNDIHVLVDGGRIYVKDQDYYLELLTQIAGQ